MYCKVEGHIVEDCPALISKWKAKAPKVNNVLKISMEYREEETTIAIITWSRLRTDEAARE